MPCLVDPWCLICTAGTTDKCFPISWINMLTTSPSPPGEWYSPEKLTAVDDKHDSFCTIWYLCLTINRNLFVIWMYATRCITWNKHNHRSQFLKPIYQYNVCIYKIIFSIKSSGQKVIRDRKYRQKEGQKNIQLCSQYCDYCYPGAVKR